MFVLKKIQKNKGHQNAWVLMNSLAWFGIGDGKNN